MFLSATGSAKVQLQVPTTVYAEEAISINCTSSVQDFENVYTPMMVLTTGHGCKNDAHGGPNKVNNYFQKSFTVTCKKGNHTIKCLTNGISQIGKIQLRGIFIFL